MQPHHPSFQPVASPQRLRTGDAWTAAVGTPLIKSSLAARLAYHTARSVQFCMRSQDHRGAWHTLPDPRLFDTGLIAFALSHAWDSRSQAAVQRARPWLRDALPQDHDRLARLLDETPRLLLEQSGAPLDLRDPEFYSEVNYRKTLVLYALATHAGVKVLSPFTLPEIRAQVGQYYAQRDRIRIKQWNKVDLIAVHVLLEARAHNREGAEEAGRTLRAMQAEDGSFSYNPLSTAMAFIALSQAASGSPAWVRCREHLLNSQQEDGTWRFCISDVWDTTLMVRTFRDHPLFAAHALPAATSFILRHQNEDGGWSFHSRLESDNDTSSCALLALHGLPGTADHVRRGAAHLARLQLPGGLWRTWQSGDDPPVEDVVAHVIAALARTRRHHQVDLAPGRRWLADRYHRFGLWLPGWYRNTPYGVLEVGRALGGRHPATRAATHALLELQNADGGWGDQPGASSSASATGLAITCLLSAFGTDAPFIRRGLELLMDTQSSDGTWEGRPELYGPRPLLYHLPTNTHAFASLGLLTACNRATPRTIPRNRPLFPGMLNPKRFRGQRSRGGARGQNHEAE